MMLKQLAAVRFVLVLVPLFGAATALFAFQQADGAPPPPHTSPKFIFYWGNLQADLSPANHFRAAEKITVHAFRQMLLRPPHLWTGSALAPQVSFRLDGHPITATRGEQDYVAKLGWLDEHFVQKATGGQTVHITELYLDGDATGSIDLLLKEPEPTELAEPVVWQNTTISMLNTRLLEQVAWGREDIHEISNRDFFTEDEFWQTIRQTPFAVWQPYIVPTEIRASIRIASRRLTEQGFSCILEGDAYRSMLANVEIYKHLVRPGSVATRMLHTDQHERLFEKNMNIVADNDPRLALRRNRDTHTLRIKWGALDQTISNLYLLPEQLDAAGNLVSTDSPISVGGTTQHGERERMLQRRPEVWIDGVPVPDLAFSLSVDKGMVSPERSTAATRRVLPGEPMPDSLAENLPDTVTTVHLHHLHAAGYDLSALTFSVSFLDLREPMLLRNTLPVLLNAPGSTRVKLESPVGLDKVYEVIFELLDPAFVRLSVFDPDGWAPYNMEERYAAGKHRVEIPRAVFRRSGKHYLFLNTPFGVAKTEWEVR